MSSNRSRRYLAFGAAVATSALAAFGGAPAAQASHSGNGNGVLTTANGGIFVNGTLLASGATTNEISWTADGSRALYVRNGQVVTSRWDATDAGNPQVIVGAPAAGAERAHPSWLGLDSNGVVWAERASATDPWQLWTAGGNPYCCMAAPDTISLQSSTAGPLTAGDGYDYTYPDGGDGSVLVFQRQSRLAGSTPEVWVYNPKANPTMRKVVGNASHPALSPDGTKVAFVRPAGTGSNQQVFTSDLSGGNVVQVTDTPAAAAGPDNHDFPSWSPNGQTLAFRNQSGGVETAAANGSAQLTHTALPGITGTPFYRSQTRESVTRISGSSRYATAAAVSAYRWATTTNPADPRPTADAVVLSRSDTFADALGGGALAGAKQGPLLMTSPTVLDGTTAAEIDRVLDPGGRIYLLGGTGAISLAIETGLLAKGYEVERLQGANRFDTSIAIANKINPNPDVVITATGANFPDALAAGAAAGAYNTPGGPKSAVVLLTSDNVLPAATKTYLDAWTVATGQKPYAVGVQAANALAPYAPIAMAGADRYQTAALVAYRFFPNMKVASLATGANWPDALAGGALMGVLGGPLLLTPGTGDVNKYSAYLLNISSGSVSEVLIFGGAGSVATTNDDQLGKLISGPGLYDKH
ncbi:hypothetical protein Cs7R123_38810 [Catellatospora sp. TT07R-123]|uniref:cell wall-binding repeat-containing protein n=1 Tax=Catellatospora sp. TT07R-123 TaxID=2733863 RepID=UPI001B03F2D9|nr:cell wall-binding repeat-containing protein [Catellatospora sp. TT07R-123]GHJ46539.1 hypothetical protein Cs7R123_38810 [Catellatospora sp. TT07R-123]